MRINPLGWSFAHQVKTTMVRWLSILAEAAPAAPAGDAAEPMSMGQFLLLVALPMMVAFFVINYFLVTRPQQRQQARHLDMLGGLKKNERVVTAGGIIGTFVSMSEDRTEVTLRVDDNTRLKFRSEYIRGVLDSTADAGEGAKTT